MRSADFNMSMKYFSIIGDNKPCYLNVRMFGRSLVVGCEGHIQDNKYG